jgi:hypothetical protein
MTCADLKGTTLSAVDIIGTSISQYVSLSGLLQVTMSPHRGRADAAHTDSGATGLFFKSQQRPFNEIHAISSILRCSAAWLEQPEDCPVSLPLER